MLLQILRQRIVVLGVNQWVFLGFTTWMHGSGVEYRIHQALFMKSRLDVGHKTCLSSQVGPHSSNMICRSRSRFPAAPDAQLLSTTGLRIQIQRWTGFWMLLCSILNVWKFFCWAQHNLLREKLHVVDWKCIYLRRKFRSLTSDNMDS